MDIIDTISCLLEHVNEEIEDCKTYAKLAMDYKECDKSLYNLYSDLASQEYVHYQLILAQMRRVQSEHLNDNDTVERFLEWQYRKIMEEASEAKVMLDMCKS